MPNERQCEFFLLRYVPDAVKDEFVNIGVILLESGRNGQGYANVRFTSDWRRVRCLDPTVDLEMLKEIEEELRRDLTQGKGPQDVRRRLEESLSNTLQLSSVKACLTDSPEEEIERLSRLYLERSYPVERGKESGRQAILSQMRQEFERAGVWRMMNKKIPMAKYTHRGDPLKIDCGYRPNGVVKLLQAVSLGTEIDSAKILAYSYPTIRSGIERTEKASAQLTAIVESDVDRSDEGIAFALSILNESKIEVASSADLPRIAEKARIELRA